MRASFRAWALPASATSWFTALNVRTACNCSSIGPSPLAHHAPEWICATRARIAILFSGWVGTAPSIAAFGWEMNPSSVVATRSTMASAPGGIVTPAACNALMIASGFVSTVTVPSLIRLMRVVKNGPLSSPADCASVSRGMVPAFFGSLVLRLPLNIFRMSQTTIEFRNTARSDTGSRESR